jgi:ubiquitin-conjugating enzyme E2 Z
MGVENTKKTNSYANKNTRQVVTPAAMNRLIKDITYIFKNPLIEQGIYYQHDDSDMFKGYAMIIGPKDTPYQHGFYFFEFIFPYNYPHQPPKVIFHTNNGNTRFNPNLYRNGKVCLSILNTWRGEGWTSCQTIRTVLLTLLTVLNEKPLLNEPGIKKTHKNYDAYNKIILYENYNFAHLKMLDIKYISLFVPNFRIFHCFMKEYALKNYEVIMGELQELYNKNPAPELVEIIDIYKMESTINYEKLLTNFPIVYDKLRDE